MPVITLLDCRTVLLGATGYYAVVDIWADPFQGDAGRFVKQVGGQAVCNAVDFAFTDPKIADIRDRLGKNGRTADAYACFLS